MNLKWKCGQIVLAAMLGMVVLLASVHAQTSNGTIVGSVTDPAGGRCAGGDSDRYKHRPGRLQTDHEDGFRGELSYRWPSTGELQCVDPGLRHAGIRGGWSCGEGVSRLHCVRIFDYRISKSVSVCRSLYWCRITNAIRRA